MTINKIIKQNVFLYKLWFYLYRKNFGTNISFFKPDTALYIDGYPRSGNTFLVHLVKTIFPDISMVHHFHAVAPIKIALAKGIPIYILARNPEDAVASNYLREHSVSAGQRGGVPASINRRLLADLLNEYSFFYKFVRKKQEAIMLIDFNEVKQDFLPTLNYINQRFHYHIAYETLSCRVQEERLTFRGAVDTLGASTPNPTKEQLKKPLKNAIRSLPDFTIAIAMYSELTGKQ